MDKYVCYNPKVLTNFVSLAEDCFESFMGCLQCLVNQNYSNNFGYNIIYHVIAQIYDPLPIQLDIVDAKTKLNETIVKFKKDKPTVRYEQHMLGDGKFTNKAIVHFEGKTLIFDAPMTANKAHGQQLLAGQVVKRLDDILQKRHIGQ